MRFKITLEQDIIGQKIPLSYQYELSSWIYRQIATANKEFSDFLHDKGFDHDKKTFKFFCFTQLQPGNGGYRIIEDRMQLNSRDVSFECSFLVGDAAAYLLRGLFENQQLSLGDKKSHAKFSVKSVELLNIPDFSSENKLFSTASPLLISMPVNINGRLGQRYLSPSNEEFPERLIQNLSNKYLTAVYHKICEPIADVANSNITFELHSKIENIKSRLISIKSGTAAETKLKGFLFDFELNANPELLKLAYLCGLGNENAMGFGSIHVLK
jgi:CRISPR-associated endoribonuclease Cas6